jgi:hypothetical protein
MSLDVRLYGKKVLVDEIGCLLVGIGLGIQPSASASGGRRAEIDQNRSVLLFRRGERLINVVAPSYSHRVLLREPQTC